MSNLSKFNYFRRKFLRPIYLPLFDLIYRNYLYLSRMKLARGFTREFNFTVNRSWDPTIVVKYDHSSSPPTYGDYLTILLIARFISMSGYKVRFEIIDVNRFGAVWGALSIKNQDLFVLDQIKLAEKFLNENCQIIIKGKFSDELMPVNQKSNVLPSNDIEVYSNEFYQWAPYFLHLLIKKHNWKIPKGFLLKSIKVKPAGNYVAWNVRKAKWANDRDTDVDSLLQDFSELRELFPDHSIMIISDQEGIDFAVSELNRFEPTFSSMLANGRISIQPDAGYLGAIDWVLSSNIYFQRSGGGMGIVAIFSSVPYVIYSIEKTNFFGHYRNRKIAPWSTKNQIFKKPFATKKTFPISKSL